MLLSDNDAFRLQSISINRHRSVTIAFVAALVLISLSMTALGEEACSTQSNSIVVDKAKGAAPSNSLGQSCKATMKLNRSFGISNLPWRDFDLSFRWWKGKGRGGEIAVANFTLKLDDLDRNLYHISFPELRIVALWRSASGALDGLLTIKGLGIGLGFTGTSKDYYGKGIPYSDELFGSVSIYLVYGFEHYFLSRYPGICYSVEGDFYLRGNFWSNSNYQFSDEDKFSMGIVPRFFLRYYF